MLVPLQGVAVRVVCALWSGNAGAAAGYRCKVLLEGAAVKGARALWSGHAGAAAGCGWKVLLEGAAVSGVCAVERACWCCWRVPLQGAAEGCENGVCALERGGAAARCRCLRVLLEGAAVRLVCSLVPLQDAAAGCCLKDASECCF